MDIIANTTEYGIFHSPNSSITSRLPWKRNIYENENNVDRKITVFNIWYCDWAFSYVGGDNYLWNKIKIITLNFIQNKIL